MMGMPTTWNWAQGRESGYAYEQIKPSRKENKMKLYAQRDPAELDRQGNFYTKHVDAMTKEGLHSKSDIAAELAHRDLLIKQLNNPKPVEGERMGDEEFRRDFKGMNATAIYEEAKRARAAEKRLEKWSKTATEDLIKLEAENATLKAQVKELKNK